MSETWEKVIQDWYNNSRTANLEYLDLTSSTEISTTQLANNLAIIYDRTCLSARVNLKHFKLILERCERLEREVSALKTALQNLTSVSAENQPLSSKNLQELIVSIVNHPKPIEEEVLRKLEKVESLFHKLERWTSS